MVVSAALSVGNQCLLLRQLAVLCKTENWLLRKVHAGNCCTTWLHRNKTPQQI